MVVVQRFAAARPPHRVLSHDYFEVRMEEECARRARTGGEFSVVRVNVTSPAASEAVQDALARALRAHDVLAVYAPLEYEIFLDTGLDGAREVTARLVAALDAAGIGASTGIATYPADGAAAGALIAAANDAVRGRKTPTPVPESGAMEGLSELVERVAAGTISVLILGETGVGKEVLAQTRASTVAAAPRRPFCASTAPRSRRRCSRASSSATSAARSPAPSRRSRACSRRPTAARCSSTRSASCRWRCR